MRGDDLLDGKEAEQVDQHEVRLLARATRHKHRTESCNNAKILVGGEGDRRRRRRKRRRRRSSRTCRRTSTAPGTNGRVDDDWHDEVLEVVVRVAGRRDVELEACDERLVEDLPELPPGGPVRPGRRTKQLLQRVNHDLVVPIVHTPLCVGKEEKPRRLFLHH